MKKITIAPIIIGSILMSAGITACGINSDPIITNEHEVGFYSNINIDIKTADLEFKVAEDGTRKVVCEEREKEYHTVEVVDDTLTIKAFDTRKWNEKAFNFNTKSMKVTIYAPSEAYNDGNIVSSTGDITIPHDYSFNNLKVTLSTGKTNVNSDCINAMNIEASTGNVNVEAKTKNLHIKVSTGDINIKNADIEEKIYAETSTGKITITDSKSQNLETISDTGRTKLDNTIMEKNIKISTHTGDVNLNDSDAETLDIETHTGDVKGTLLTSKIFYAHSNTGSVNVPESTTGGLCKINTRTGDISIKIKNS